MAFDKGDILGPLGGLGDIIDYVITGGNPETGRNNLVRQLTDPVVVGAANVGVASDNALTALDRGIEHTKGFVGITPENELNLRPYRNYYSMQDLYEDKINPWDVASGTVTAAPFLRPAANIVSSGARAIEGTVRPLVMESVATQEAKARAADFMRQAEQASGRGLFGEVPFKPAMSNAEFAEAAYAGKPADAFIPPSYTGRPAIQVPLEDYVGSNASRLEAELGRKATAPQAQMLAKDLRLAENPAYISIDPIPTNPNLNYFTSEALRDAALREALGTPLKQGAIGNVIVGSGEMLDPNNPAKEQARDELGYVDAVSKLINSNTAQPDSQPVSGSQLPSQPTSFSRPAPLAPVDPTQMLTYPGAMERPKEFNEITKMDTSTLRDYYLKQTNGALDIGPIAELVSKIPDFEEGYEKAITELNAATNQAGIEASDSWKSTIGWLITIPFAIRQGMSPDELWEKIVNSRISINPRVMQAQAALNRIEAIRKARMDAIKELVPLLGYAITGLTNPELAEARTLKTLADAARARADTEQLQAKTKKTNLITQGLSNAFGQPSPYVSATAQLQAKANKSK